MLKKISYFTLHMCLYTFLISLWCSNWKVFAEQFYFCHLALWSVVARSINNSVRVQKKLWCLSFIILKWTNYLSISLIFLLYWLHALTIIQIDSISMIEWGHCVVCGVCIFFLSDWVLSGHSGFLPQFRDVHRVWLTSDCQLPGLEYMSVSIC